MNSNVGIRIAAKSYNMWPHGMIQSCGHIKDAGWCWDITCGHTYNVAVGTIKLVQRHNSHKLIQ